MNVKNKYFIYLAALAVGATLLAGCQDHHWKAYDEMEEHPEIATEQKGKAPVAPPIESQYGTADMLSEYRADNKSSVLVSGTVELDPSAEGADYNGWVLYVIARPAEGQGLLAAIKAENVKFPYEFHIMPKDIMFGEPNQDMTYFVDARFDSDGDLDTKDAIDLFGRNDGEPLPMGADNALVTIKKKES